MADGFAWLYYRGLKKGSPLFTMLFLLQTAALAATASCADLFNLFVCLELLGIASYALVASSEKGAAFLASFSYLAVSSTAMCFFLFGVFGFYQLTGSLSYSEIASSLAALSPEYSFPAAISLACIVAASAVRVAVLPVYGWLPDAHAMAPHAVSAVLSGVLIKTPLFALGRLLSTFGAVPGLGSVLVERAITLLGIAGALTALSAVLVALCQKDAKRLLAYHSISQIGYIVVAWSLFSGAGLSAAWLHAFNHALFKGLLFLSIGTATDIVASSGGNRSRDVYLIRGAARLLRRAGDGGGITLLGFCIGALSIAAMPPLNGFGSKMAITALLDHDWRYWVLYAASIGTLASMMKLSLIFFPAKSGYAGPRIDLESEPAGLSLPMKIAMASLSLLCILTGLFSNRLSLFVSQLLGTEPLRPLPDIISVEVIKTVGPLVALGGILFLFARSELGKHISSLVRSRPRSFAGLVLSFSLGLALLAFL